MSKTHAIMMRRYALVVVLTAAALACGTAALGVNSPAALGVNSTAALGVNSTAALDVNSTISTTDDVPLATPTDCIRNETTADGWVCVKEGRVLTWSCVGVVTGCAFGGFFVFAACLPCCLKCIGFGSIGPRGGSAASNFQSMFGTPYAFREAQSSSMTGRFSMCSRATIGLLGAVLLAVAGSYMSPCFGEVQVPY
jgi:hypothetical protein